jgi:hypothetical protein
MPADDTGKGMVKAEDDAILYMRPIHRHRTPIEESGLRTHDPGC